MSRFLSTLVALSFVGFAAAQAPESLKGADKTLYDTLKKGEGDADQAESKAVIEKQAKYLVGRLSDPANIENQSNNLTVAREALPWQKDKPKTDISAAQLKFNHEMGHAMVAELKPALKHSKLIVRVNAARMLSLVAMIGCDEVVAPALEILADPKETDGVKFFALQTLTNIFAYVTEPSAPEKSAFRKESRDIENKAIQFLCDFVLRKHDVKGMSPEQVGVIHYLRREAVRALGHVRAHRLQFQGAVLAKPGWVLLRVANRDGIEPEPELLERTEAILGFTQLFPVTQSNVDRDIDIEYAADRLAAPILEIINIKVNPPLGQALAIASVPWLVTVNNWDNGLNKWQTNVNENKLTNAASAKAMQTQASTLLFAPMKANSAANTDAFQVWFSGNRAKGTELYKGDPASAVKPVN